MLIVLVAGLSLFVFSSTYVPLRSPTAPSLRTSSLALPNLTRQGLVLPMGTGNAPDALQVGYPSVLVDRGVYKMWYFEVQPSPWYAQIAYATSLDGRNWTKHGAVLSPSYAQESFDVAYPTVALVNGTYWMWYNGYDGSSVYRIFAATSADGVNWTKHGVVLDVGPAGSQDSASVAYPFVLFDNGTFRMWYTGLSSFSPPGNAAIMYATSANGLNWTKEGTVLTVGSAGSIDAYNVFTSGVVRDGSRLVMTYMGQDANGTSHILWAVSSDGVGWTRAGVALLPDPPAENGIGQADPLILADGTWMVYYAVRNYSSDIQIYLATSGNSTSSGNTTSPPSTSPSPPSPPPESIPPSSPSSAAPGSGGLLSPALGSFYAFAAAVSPAVAVGLVTLAGAAVGAGLGAFVLRKRTR